MNKKIRLHKLAASIYMAVMVVASTQTVGQTTDKAKKAVSIKVDLKNTVGDMYPMWA